MYVWRNIDARLGNHCCSGKAVSVTYSLCVFVAAGILHAMLTPRILICGLRPLLRFPALSHKQNDFRSKGFWTQNFCVLVFCATFVWNVSHCKKHRARYDTKNVCWSSCKVLVIVGRNLNLLDRFSKSTEISNFMKIFPVVVEFCADVVAGRNGRLG